MTPDQFENNAAANGSDNLVDPNTLFLLAQVVTGVVLAATAFTNPTFGQLESLYKQKGLL